MRVTVGGDTVINGRPCKELIKTKESSFQGNDPVTLAVGSEFMYEENGLIMAYDPVLSSFDTLYNMDALPGDNWQLAALPEPLCYQQSYMLVTDTGTTMINEIALRWLAVEINYYSSSEELEWTANDTIIDRIGSVSSYLLPMDFCMAWVDGNEAGPLRCYSDAQIEYMTDENTPCELVLGTAEVQNSFDLQIWPNPGSDQLKINLRSSADMRIEIHSFLGEVLRSERDINDQIEIETSDLPAGIYSIHLIDGERRSAVKWIKL